MIKKLHKFQKAMHLALDLEVITIIFIYYKIIKILSFMNKVPQM